MTKQVGEEASTQTKVVKEVISYAHPRDLHCMAHYIIVI